MRLESRCPLKARGGDPIREDLEDVVVLETLLDQTVPPVHHALHGRTTVVQAEAVAELRQVEQHRPQVGVGEGVVLVPHRHQDSRHDARGLAETKKKGGRGGGGETPNRRRERASLYAPFRVTIQLRTRLSISRSVVEPLREGIVICTVRGDHTTAHTPLNQSFSR